MELLFHKGVDSEKVEKRLRVKTRTKRMRSQDSRGKLKIEHKRSSRVIDTRKFARVPTISPEPLHLPLPCLTS
jgi:hypothetical protein